MCMYVLLRLDGIYKFLILPNLTCGCHHNTRSSYLQAWVANHALPVKAVSTRMLAINWPINSNSAYFLEWGRSIVAWTTSPHWKPSQIISWEIIACSGKERARWGWSDREDMWQATKRAFRGIFPREISYNSLIVPSETPSAILPRL